jgi:hypothetical protein
MPATKTEDATAVLEKIAAMAPHQEIAARIHDVIITAVPELQPRLWYGMPGYATSKTSPVLCFFRVDGDLITFGLTEKANISREEKAPDHLIESAWFLRELDEPTESRIADIVRRAVR